MRSFQKRIAEAQARSIKLLYERIAPAPAPEIAMDSLELLGC